VFEKMESHQHITPQRNIEQSERFPVLDSEKRLETGKQLASVALTISQLTDDFVAIERIPRFSKGQRENDVEHSYMLALAAPEMLNLLHLDLNTEKVTRFALAHDLIEVKVGDVATFNLSPEQLHEKERIEQEAKAALLQELPPLIADSLEEYERQDTPEAIFVRMVDKLLPLAVDVTGDGIRVLKEDYGVSSYDELVHSHDALHARIDEKFGSDFPDLVAAHAVMCEIIEKKYLDTIDSFQDKEKLREPTEIERKYRINLENLPDDIDLTEVRRSELQQGYIAVGADGSETRVRSFDGERFELTTKSPGMIAREEQTIKLTAEMFESLWEQTAGSRVEKTRYYIPFGDLMIELDIYHGHLEGLVTAELEFDGRRAEAMIRANTFEPPQWFGEDISFDSRYKNHSLAQQLPVEPIPLGAKQY
jgi:adenylate cyclase